MSTTAFASPGNNLSSTLRLNYVAGDGECTLARNYGDEIRAELTRQGLPSISALAPLRFRLARAEALNLTTGQVIDATLTTIYEATGLSGDTLSGLTAVEGTTDQDFDRQSVFTVEGTAGQTVAMQAAINALQSVGGSVTSVGLSMPTGFSVASSPITSSGTIAVTTALSGILKGATGAITTATAGTDYLTPSGNGSGLTALTPANISAGTAGINISGNAATATLAMTAATATTATNVSGTVAIANGGTGQATANAAFGALGPLSTLGDTLYFSTVNARLAGNTTAVPKAYRQTGTGSVSAAPFWGEEFAVLVDDFGAVGNGSTDDTAAILLAIASGKNITFRAGATYVTSNTLFLNAGQIVYGNGATIKRATPVSTTTATTIVNGVTTAITVASTAGMVVGQRYSVLQPGALGGTFDRSSHVIATIVGSVVTFGDALTVDLTGTTQVYQCWNSFQFSASGGCKVTNLTFDGNQSNWTYARWSTTMEVNQLGDYTVVEKCYFVNIPGDAVIAGGTGPRIVDCWFYNCDGNATHWSGARHGVVDRCWAKNINLDTNVGHGYGAYIWSADNQDCAILNSYAENAICGMAYPLQTDDSRVTIMGCTARNCTTYGIAVNVSTSTESPTDVLIVGNQINTCVTGIRIAQTQFPATAFPTRYVIANNTFIGNTTNAIRCLETVNTSITGNTITHAGTSANYAVFLNDCIDLVFGENVVEGGDYGCWVQASNSLTANVTIRSNFMGQAFGAVVFTTANMLNVSAKGCTISNTVSADSTYIGISCAGKAQAMGNSLYLLAGATGISLLGNNGLAIGNYIEGPTGTFRSIRASSGSGTGNTVCNNVSNQPVSDSHAGSNMFSGNIDYGATNSQPLLSLNTGGNVEAPITAMGPSANISIDLLPTGTGAIRLRKAERNVFTGQPTIAAQANLGSTATAATSSTSTGIAGTVTLTPGGTGIALGFLARMTFATAPGQTTQIAFAPTNAAAVNAGLYLDSKTSKLRVDIYSVNAPISATAITFDYRVIEQASG
jgi:hypothetical protein